jgi:hypothetical protein
MTVADWPQDPRTEIVTMQKRTKQKLGLKSETLKTLKALDLLQVAGGTEAYRNEYVVRPVPGWWTA